jgi:transcriptional regulator with XRE-family HTH domain
MNSDKENLSFGEALCELIKEANLSQADFYRGIGITKSYFYDIVSGKTKPPPGELQIKVIEFLNLSSRDRTLLFELASKERQETPVDIAWYLRKNDEAKSVIREEINYYMLFDKT